MTAPKIVRQANTNGGPCNLLGTLESVGENRVVYHCRGLVKAFIPRRLVHLEPCYSCRDHASSRFPHLR
jgi:hypothetical protein